MRSGKCRRIPLLPHSEEIVFSVAIMKLQLQMNFLPFFECVRHTVVHKSYSSNGSVWVHTSQGDSTSQLMGWVICVYIVFAKLGNDLIMTLLIANRKSAPPAPSPSLPARTAAWLRLHMDTVYHMDPSGK